MVRLAQVKGIWDPWKANFSGYLPANEKLIEEWQKDEEFCRQYLQGRPELFSRKRPLRFCSKRWQNFEHDTPEALPYVVFDSQP